MEQQPGPVNWARFNPSPLPGMVRLWTLEAAAHGAELVSYFRWRQAPFGQEAHHAGLLRPDSSEDVGAAEARQVAGELASLGDLTIGQAPVALLFSYPASWVFETQPQGADCRYLELAFLWYQALRRLGLDVDILPPDADLSGYRMIVAPSLPMIDADLVTRLAGFGVPVLFGPRTGSRDEDMATPVALPPGPLQSALPIKVQRVESLREGVIEAGPGFTVARWFEHVDGPAEIAQEDGRGIVFRQDMLRYVAGWPDAALLQQLLRSMAVESGVVTADLPADVRVRRAGDWCFAFNYGPEVVSLEGVVPTGADLLIGQHNLRPAGVAAWRADPLP